MRDVWKVLLVGVLCYLSTEVGLAHKHYVEGVAGPFEQQCEPRDAAFAVGSGFLIERLVA